MYIYIYTKDFISREKSNFPQWPQCIV